MNNRLLCYYAWQNSLFAFETAWDFRLNVILLVFLCVHFPLNWKTTFYTAKFFTWIVCKTFPQCTLSIACLCVFFRFFFFERGKRKMKLELNVTSSDKYRLSFNVLCHVLLFRLHKLEQKASNEWQRYTHQK